MDQITEWVFRGVAAALVAAFAALFGRLRRVENTQGRFEERIDDLEGRDTGAAAVAGLREDVHSLRLCLERNFVRREDWVPTMSRIEGILERQSETLARVDERQKLHDDR